MHTHLVLTVISDDKPGVVELLAQTITHCQGNWLESHMAHLAGKFAGILQVSVPEERHSELSEMLTELSAQGLKIIVEVAHNNGQSSGKEFYFNVMGNDRPGIVHEIAQAFASRNINMRELETACSSMPWSGEPMFEATGLIEIPSTVDMEAFHKQLDAIADELAVDIQLDAPPPEETQH